MKLIEILKQASKRKSKYPKVKYNTYTCKNCKISRYYNTLKCPTCEGKVI